MACFVPFIRCPCLDVPSIGKSSSPALSSTRRIAIPPSYRQRRHQGVKNRHSAVAVVVSSTAGPAALAALLLALSPIVAEPTTLPSHEPSTLAAADDASKQPQADSEDALREQSRQNTHVSGKAAQLFATARRQAVAGELSEALTSYNELVELAPTFAPAHSNRANIYVVQHRYRDAVDDYTTAIQLAPLDSDAWVLYLNRGSTYLALGEATPALEDLNTALAFGKGDRRTIYANRAACFEILGKWDIALRDYQRAVEINANDVQPWWIRYALVLFQQDRSQETLGILKRVTTRFDGSELRAALAAVYFARGELGEAETQWAALERPRLFLSRSFLESEKKWPPKVIDALEEFGTGRARVPAE